MKIQDHASAAETFNKDEKRVNWHDEALWFVRSKRDLAVNQIPEWENLRQLASEIKTNVLANLGDYLQEFEKNAMANGIHVHWAADGEEHNKILHEILKKHDAKRLVKSKSMLTEECHLNEYLEKHGFEVVDTDLGERIVQLKKEPPSHIVLPAIHLKKEEVGDLFHNTIGTEKGEKDPQKLTEAARQHLREKFLKADVAVTGVNFAIAETGGFVVCTNEGNADMGVHLCDVHIASMGIEKILPKREHLGIFLRLLARNATGQPITTYSSHFLKPATGQEMHVILVDNGRTRQLASEDFRNALKCIRCGACLNTCPVYRRSGGHSYHHVVAGPIGAILAPNFDMEKNADLPFASTLCGSCTNVCPVKIDIHDQLWKWRQIIVKNGHVSMEKKLGMKFASYLFSKPSFYRFVGKSGLKFMRIFPGIVNNGKVNPWGKGRVMPVPPKESFRDWYLKNKKDKE